MEAVDKMQSRIGRVAVGLIAVVSIVLVACGGNALPAATEPLASSPVTQKNALAAASTAVPQEAKRSEPATSPSASTDAPVPAMASAANGGSVPVDQNPSANSTVPSESPLLVGQTIGVLRDLAVILDAEPQIVDITAHSARVIATTTIDVACAVAYGQTTEYGRLAVDSDMAGTGHSDHGPLMTGLEPDTTYHLTFGGIGPDGMVYSYKDLTFRTLPADFAPEASVRGENLALAGEGAHVANVSSNFGSTSMDSAFGANNALDGNPSTEWSSQGDGDGAWIEIELAHLTKVTSLGFWTRTMGTSAQIMSFRVITGNGDVFGPFSLDDASSVHYFDVDFTARSLRIEAVDTSGGNTGAVEIEVYGQPVP